MDNLLERQRLLIFRLVHTINREQELAAPMVMSYLMGWDDNLLTHNFSSIYWGGFISSLLSAHAELRSMHDTRISSRYHRLTALYRIAHDFSGRKGHG